MFKPIEIENIVDINYQNTLYNLVTNIEFPWHFMEDTTTEKSYEKLATTPCFGNLIYHPSNNENPYKDYFTPVLNSLIDNLNMKIHAVHRIRLGFLLNTKYTFAGAPYQHNTIHRDLDIPHWTAIYYLNDCDGDTVIFRETEISKRYYPLHKSQPKKGKLLIFDGLHYHASTCPKVHNKRIVCTINFSADLL